MEQSMCRLSWADLLIQDFTPEDCQRWLAPWSGFVGGPVGPEFLNKFGSWFLRRPEGRVEMLNVLTGAVEEMAKSYEEFVPLVNDQRWQETYLLSELVYQLHQRGTIPGVGQCYALAPHPALCGPNPANGEQVDPRFVMVMEIGLWQSLCAQAVRATR
jgi:hypothetical protein